MRGDKDLMKPACEVTKITCFRKLSRSLSSYGSITGRRQFRLDGFSSKSQHVGDNRDKKGTRIYLHEKQGGY
ncbi:hypothetical protein JOQ06_026234, partial [Pogonophryne albipinna]